MKISKALEKYWQDNPGRKERIQNAIRVAEKDKKLFGNNKLYSYLFHFNHHTNQWAAIPRSKEASYFNNMNDRVNTGILYAEDINTLIEFLSR